MTSIDDLLEDWSVLEDHDGPNGWYAVANDDGIIAYFCIEKQAYLFRLLMINLAMNV